jgi:hypothetical protein
MPSGLDAHDDEKVFGGRHLMVSYATAPGGLERYAALGASIVLDNGAFSEWKRGEPLDVPGFYAWARRAVELPSVAWFVVPDVIGGGECENDELLAGVPAELRPVGVPVWHPHESAERVRRLCDSWPRIALGGSPSYPTPASESWWTRIALAWSAIPRTTRVHGLRMADPRIVERCPFASVDSTTAGRHANLGAKYEGPLATCRPATRVRAYAEHLEAARAPFAFVPPPVVAQGRLAFGAA